MSISSHGFDPRWDRRDLPITCLLTAQAARFSTGQYGFDSRQGRPLCECSVQQQHPTVPWSEYGRKSRHSLWQARASPSRLRAVPGPVVQWLTTAGCLPANAGSIPVGIASPSRSASTPPLWSHDPTVRMADCRSARTGSTPVGTASLMIPSASGQAGRPSLGQRGFDSRRDCRLLVLRPCRPLV